MLTVWGRQDPHVPLDGRNLIRARLEEVGANFQWHEVNGQHAFLRDEGPRYDPALAYLCYGLVFELFHRRLGSGGQLPEDVLEQPYARTEGVAAILDDLG